MRERLQSTVEIKRYVQGGISGQYDIPLTVATVSITDGSVRAFMLMQYDYVRLVFSLNSAVNFKVGDWIEDEIFGRFVITKPQMPTYNTTTGGYDYNLQFDAPYYLWANKVFMLTTVNTSNNCVRKETDWCLTDKLETHLDEVINNLTILGYTGYTYSVTAEKADEVRFLQYSGIDIISALNRMAEEWECEWWVREKVIYFGKCEDSGEATDFELGVNVESMEIRNNRNEYANKLFAYGSTRNLPFSYRKELVFDVKDVTTQSGNTIYGDTARPITPAMIERTQAEFDYVSYYLAANYDDRPNGCDASSDDFMIMDETRLVCDDLEAEIGLEFNSHNMSNYVIIAKVELMQGNRVVKTLKQQKITGNSGGNLTKTEIMLLQFSVDVQEGIYTIATTIDISVSNGSISTMMLAGSIEILQGGESKWCNLYLESDTNHTNPYKVWFNPLKVAAGQQYYGYFKFDSTTPAPSGFIPGTKFVLDGLKETEIPAYYYTTEYNDPSSLAKLGEVRLELPVSTGGYIAKSGISDDQTVESVILFDDVYPHAIQKVSSVDTTDKESEEDQQDGTSMIWAWTQYHLQATLADGTAFPFKTDYISDLEDLKIKFISREDLEAAEYTHTSGAEYRLAGMTFNVEFDNATQTYTIVRNEDFGAKLPNETLKPMVGDPFVLINWNVKAMESLGLIDAAEAVLQSKTQQYLNAMEEDQFTFACNIMSGYLFELGAAIRQKYYNLDVPFHVYDGSQLYVRMPDDYYILPIEGKKIRIIHGALSGDKVSRVIGYQFKLDKPYDTPQYEVGETERYSRLSKIEKQITKLS